MADEQQQVETFELPEDFVYTPVPTEGAAAPDGSVLGASPVPGGSELYGGVGLDVWDSADGSTYVIMCGERGPGRLFGTYCFRYRAGSNTPEWVELPGFTEGRAGVQERPDGLYAAWAERGGRAWSRYKVPGYITPGWPSNGKTIEAGPVSITTTPPAASFKDDEARKELASLKKQLDAANKRLAALEARPAGGAALDLTALDRRVDDRLWAKFPDALFHYLKNAGGGYLGELKRIIRETMAGK